MSDANTTDKTYTQKDIDIERGHAQHFKSQLDELTTKMKAFEGLDVEGLKAKARRAEELENQNALGDPKKLEERIQSARAEAETAAQKRFGDKLTELEGLTTQQAKELHSLRVTNVAVQKAAEVGYAADGIKFLKREVDARCEFQDGKIIVKGDDGKPLYSKTNPRELMELDEWLTIFGEENPCLMEPTTRKGASDGTKGKPVNASPVRFPDFRGMTQDQQTKWFAENPEGAKAFRENGYRTN